MTDDLRSRTDIARNTAKVTNEFVKGACANIVSEWLFVGCEIGYKKKHI